MMTVEEARRIIAETIPFGPDATTPLREACGRVLAQDVHTKHDSPRFDTSAMDGYAVRDLEARMLTVVGTIAAGDVSQKTLEKGEALRIMTGAMIPPGATAVIRQEDVSIVDATTITIARDAKSGENIRRRGEELCAGAIALTKGICLTPGAIGFLASQGIMQASVVAPPRVALLPTGNELVRDPAELVDGKIIDSSSWSIPSCLQQVEITPTLFPPARDQRNVLAVTVKAALDDHDILLVTGGVSVGEFDLVKEMLADIRFETLFWRVRQKPGMPLLLARRGKQFVFGLPGNPASSLMCCYEYVVPALKKWLGFNDLWPREEKARTLEPFTKRDGKTHFVRARAERRSEGCWVSHAKLQGSHLMRAFAEANCLMVVPQDVEELRVGDSVTIHWLE